ncbi:acetylornithine deacetylase [Limimaricola cinnabarinus]|jgi:acetylornithine deacetylase|uniref:Acetylornithine deacetylase n=1 Tax=Limimaricola cinnabarinus TaxID=1125964 RepID=A0A2G1MF69_9RHOB|nr:acetylornithine deacetylase [Limimaricola cinnabarinus]PHP27389.1 acetylornithine deacetylase [Limimaricola cinnabarinus]
MSALDETIALLSRMIAHPTVSDRGNRDLVEFLAIRLRADGARVRILPDMGGEKANLLASVGPKADGGLLLSGHLDVVPPGEGWSSDPFTLRRAAGRLHGRGACDMKGFVAACVTMLPRLARRGAPVHLALTHDEEVGCLGAQALARAMAAEGPRPAMAIIGEPTRMRVIEGHKGCFEYTTRFTGRDGHGSAPDLGLNAGWAAARFALRLEALAGELKAMRPEGVFDPPWATVSLGRIEAGVARNVIAGQAAVEWEMRPVSEAEARHVKQALADHAETEMAAHPGLVMKTECFGEVAGLEPRAANEARDLMLELVGGTPGLVPFGTEAGIWQALGMDAVLCGPGDIAQAHRPDEYLEESQLAACLDMLGALAARP